jgi:hypothetical protein
MGLFSFYLGYRTAKKRAQRERDRFEDEQLIDVSGDETCTNCGYEFYRHSDEGDCPQYM